jgi:DNA-binding response OmpR family regulator
MAFGQSNSAAVNGFTTPTSTAQAIPSAEILLLDSDIVTATLAPMLRNSYRVALASSVATARDYLRRRCIDLMVIDMHLPDGPTLDLCREAKALPKPPLVLVTTDNVQQVPEALEVQCDGVLLKPFAPNLLVARIARLIRARSQTTDHAASAGTNRFWRETPCPHCERQGVTSFEFASHRQAWYACSGCKKVWLGKRQE